MNKRGLKIVGGSLALLLVLGVAVLAGGQPNRAVADSPAAQANAPAAQDESEKGVVVIHVDTDGPAAQAGVKRGDILLSIDGEEVNDEFDIQRVLSGHEAGDAVSLVLTHGDDQRTLTATLTEHYAQPYLGIVSAGSPRRAFRLFADASQPTIVEVLTGSPADKAGLKAGDRVIAIDGQDLTGDLAGTIAKHAPGDQITLRVEREGEDEPLELTVTLGEHPEQAGKAYLGVNYRPGAFFDGFEKFPIPQGDLRFPFGDMPFKFDLPELQGLVSGWVIGPVAEDSPASAAGLRPGDVITAIDGESLADGRSLPEAIAAHQPGDKVALTVSRNGESLNVEVTLGENPDQADKAYLGVTIAGFFNMREFTDDAGPNVFAWPDGRDFNFHVPFDVFPLPRPAPDVPPAASPDSTTL